MTIRLLLTTLFIVAAMLTFGGGLIAGAGQILKSQVDVVTGLLTAAAGTLLLAVLVEFLFSTLAAASGTTVAEVDGRRKSN